MLLVQANYKIPSLSYILFLCFVLHKVVGLIPRIYTVLHLITLYKICKTNM